MSFQNTRAFSSSSTRSGSGSGFGFGFGSDFRSGSGSGSGVGSGFGFGSAVGSGSGSVMVGTDSQESMRVLNGRLAGYLEQVRLLQESNSELETRIAQLVAERRGAAQTDTSKHQPPLDTLREQLKHMTLDNANLMLMIDNAKLAAEDFRVKFETEFALRQGVEHDVANLRKLIDDTNVSRLQLESQLESLKEELILMKKDHEEDISELKGQIKESSIDVQMEATKGEDLSEIMTKIRQQYEKMAKQQQEETEAWYQAKFDEITEEVSKSSESVQQGRSELQELKRQKQVLEIELEAMYSMKRSLQDNLDETLRRYALEMNHHSAGVQQLEAELAEVHAQVARQGAEYQALLNIKTKLEEEIATYQRLLEATGAEDDYGGVWDSGVRRGGNVVNDDVKGPWAGEGGDVKGSGDVKGPWAREEGDVKGSGDVKGPWAREEGDVKGSGDVKDANVNGPGKDKVAGFDAAVDSLDFDLPDGESVEFSLEQALNAAAPPCPIPDTSLAFSDDIVEENSAPVIKSEVIDVSVGAEKTEERDTDERWEEEEEEVVKGALNEEEGLEKLGAEVSLAPPHPVSDAENGHVSDGGRGEKAVTLNLTAENDGAEKEKAAVIRDESSDSKPEEVMEKKGEVEEEAEECK